MYKVHIGYTAIGRNKYRKFSTLQAAIEYCDSVFLKTGVVLSIVAL